MEMEKYWAHLGRNPDTHVCVHQMYQKTMMIIETEKDWELFCFNCVLRDTEVGGDLLFAAQITASTNSYCTVYVARLVLNSYCMVYVAYPSTFVRFR
jgi:hypothetical protein